MSSILSDMSEFDVLDEAHLSRLSDLPDEVIHQILLQASPDAALALERTSKRFRAICNDSLIWRQHCRTEFLTWAARHEYAAKSKKPVKSVDWKKLYLEKKAIEDKTQALLNSILEHQSDRIEKFEQITDLGYDAKDTLLRQGQVSPSEGDGLARRYYANSVLSGVYRSLAIAEWDKLREGYEVGLERALGAFDMMISWSRREDIDDITSRLDEITQAIRDNYRDIEGMTPRQKAVAIAEYLHEQKLTGIETGREYHSIEHNFLGFALFSEHHNSLPLVSSAIYCYIARKFGLDASPCGFPLHILVIIQSTPGLDLDGREVASTAPEQKMYMDPFRSSLETPVENLRMQLNFLVPQTELHATFLQAASTKEMVVRCARNIRLSADTALDGHTSALDLDSVKYAACWAQMLLHTGPGNTNADMQVQTPPLRTLRETLPHLLEEFVANFPSDIALIEKHMIPLFRGLGEYHHLREAIHVMRVTDRKPKQAHHRNTDETRGVRFKVGQVFTHRRYRYNAAIVGWDIKCEAGPAWEQSNGVSRLSKGGLQSFYHALAQDKTIRYVAEENIEIITPDEFDTGPAFPDYAGRYFKRWDRETNRFISNIRGEYPDD